MELFARRRYFFCSYCNTFEFIETDALDRLRILSDTDPPMPCPVCAERLGHALLDDGHRVLHCKKCRGILLQRSIFSDTVSRRRASATGPGTIPAPLDRRELRRVVTCPQCRQRMDVHPYYGPGGIVIDTCSRCDAVWLDSGELGQITAAPGSDRGQ
jgi:Zn-finger nucleic acid-binding protein